MRAPGAVAGYPPLTLWHLPGKSGQEAGGGQAASLPVARLRLPCIAPAPEYGLRAPSRPLSPAPPLAPPFLRWRTMTRMLRETSVAIQQQNSPAPWEGAG